MKNPYSNEHSARLYTLKDDYQIYRKNNKFGKGIHAIFAVPFKGPSKLISIRFDAKKFTSNQAKTWLQGHSTKFGRVIKFEAAKINYNPFGQFHEGDIISHEKYPNAYYEVIFVIGPKSLVKNNGEYAISSIEDIEKYYRISFRLALSHWKLVYRR